MLYLVSLERSVSFPRIEGNVIDQERFSQSPSLIFFPPSGFRNTSNLEGEGI